MQRLQFRPLQKSTASQTHSYIHPLPWGCVRMVCTLKTNRRPIATAREMDVGLDNRRRRDGLERRGDRGRIRVHMKEGKREGERQGGRG